MRKRGRPPYPDILTPREWEVLSLLREGLTNEQIAERLDITRHAVRYHVSEILSKLGVSSRQDAAAWQPQKARPAWMGALAFVLWPLRHAPLGLAARAAGAAGVIAAAGGIGFLTWGLVVTNRHGDDDLAGLLPSPTAAAWLTPTVYPSPTPFVTVTPAPTPTSLPDPKRTVEGTGTPSDCLAASPNPSEAAVNPGEPTRYARGIYSIGGDGSALALLADRTGSVVGTAAWNALYQTYSVTSDGTTLAFVAGSQLSPELYVAAPPGAEPRLLATFQRGVWNLAIAPGGGSIAVIGDDEKGQGLLLQLVDTRDGSVTPVTVGLRWPSGEPVWSPDGGWLAIAGREVMDGPSVVYVPRPDGSGLRRLAAGGPPMAWSPDGSRLAFAVTRWEEGAGIYIADLDGNEAKASDSVVAQSASPPLTWSPDGRCLAFVAVGSTSEDPFPLRVLDVETGSEVYLASDVSDPVWSPDGSRIAFIRDGNLWVMNIDGSEQTRLTNPSQPFVQEPAWLPDGSELLFAYAPTMGSSVYVASVDGTGEVNLADGSEPVFSPDGTQIAFRGGGSGPATGSSDEIYVMNSDGTGVHKIGDAFHSDALSGCRTRDPFVWSPDGRSVAYCDDDVTGLRGVMVAPADGSSEPQLLVHSQSADWSPDGGRLAYTAYDDSRSAWQVSIADSQAPGNGRWLTEGEYPVWSPDGRRIAFVRYTTGGRSWGYVINVDGSKLKELGNFGPPLRWSRDGTRLVTTAGGLRVVNVDSGEEKKLAETAYDAVWSPDGTQIAFTLWDPPTSSVYIVSADGSGEPRKLTDGDGPSWSPDGTRIAFAR